MWVLQTQEAGQPPLRDPVPAEPRLSWFMDLEASAQPDSEAIAQLEQQHRHYSEMLEALHQKPWLSEDEQLEEVRLKKLKLHAKDLIYALERRTPAVA